MDLFMNSSLLGWLKVRPVVNPQRVRKYLELLQAGQLQLMIAPSTALEGYVSALQLIGSLEAQGDALFMSEDSSTLFVLGDGHATTAGLGAQDLQQPKGVPLLRRQHIVLGHASLPRVLTAIKASGRKDTDITSEDIRQFLAENCGPCETAKMSRRAFTLNTLADHTPVPIGKKRMLDSLELRLPSREFGYIHIGLYVCVTSHRATASA